MNVSFISFLKGDYNEKSKTTIDDHLGLYPDFCRDTGRIG